MITRFASARLWAALLLLSLGLREGCADEKTHKVGQVFEVGDDHLHESALIPMFAMLIMIQMNHETDEPTSAVYR